MAADDTGRDHKANKRIERELVGYERWIETLRGSCGIFDLQKIERKSFAGWFRPVIVGRFRGSEVSHNAPLIRRIPRDVRADGAEHFCMSLQLSGLGELTQNEEAMGVRSGDIIVSDTARALEYHTRRGSRVITLQLPRADFVTHMGFEPRTIVRPSGDSLAGRMLAQVFESVYLDEGDVEPDLDLVIYDVIRALFRPDEWMGVSSHTEKLFERVQHIIERHFADPDFGPAEVALEAGISSRYLQKLFASRGTTCNRCIESRRLERAFKLLKRRIEQNGGPSIAEIAFDSGYRNVNYFYSRFRKRFGCTPGELPMGDNLIQSHETDESDTA
jgi:AraC family transcriptional regulator, positive regulator of tynA and feaB